MICSVLIPSRKRVDRLKKTIESIIATTTEVEIIVRADIDDKETVDFLKEAYDKKYVDTYIVGERKNGWYSICDFYQEMVHVSRGTWILVMNDDCTVEGHGWDEKLKSIPANGVMVYPEIHVLGGSTYTNDVGGPFPIVPNKCWEQYGFETIPPVVDLGLYELLVKEHNWNIAFIKGMTGNHQRDNDQQLEAHRKL